MVAQHFRDLSNPHASFLAPAPGTRINPSARNAGTGFRPPRSWLDRSLCPSRRWLDAVLDLHRCGAWFCPGSGLEGLSIAPSTMKPCGNCLHAFAALSKIDSGKGNLADQLGFWRIIVSGSPRSAAHSKTLVAAGFHERWCNLRGLRLSWAVKVFQVRADHGERYIAFPAAPTSFRD